MIVCVCVYVHAISSTSLTTEGNPLLIRKTVKEVPSYINTSLTYHRRKSLTNNENIQGNPLL